MQIPSNSPLNFGLTVKVAPGVNVSKTELEVGMLKATRLALSDAYQAELQPFGGLYFNHPAAESANKDLFLVVDGPNDKNYTKLSRMMLRATNYERRRQNGDNSDELRRNLDDAQDKIRQIKLDYIENYDATLIRDAQGNLRVIKRKDEAKPAEKVLAIG